MNTYKWANLALMGMLLLGIGIGRACGNDSDTILVYPGIALMAAGVVQALRGMQKQIDEMKSDSEKPVASNDTNPRD